MNSNKIDKMIGIFKLVQSISILTMGFSIGIYDRKHNTFFVYFKNSREAIDRSNELFKTMYESLTKEK
jgi:hypothetical protein